MARIGNHTVNGTGSTRKLSSHRDVEFSACQALILSGTAGYREGTVNFATLTVSGTFTFKVSDFGIMTPGVDEKTYAVALTSGDDSTAVIAKLEAAFGAHATASIATGKLRITNNKVGGSNSTVTFVSVSTAQLGVDLGWADISSVETTALTAGTSAGTISLYGRINIDDPFTLIKTYSADTVEQVTLMPEVRTVAASIGAQGVLRLDLDAEFDPEDVNRTNY